MSSLLDGLSTDAVASVRARLEAVRADRTRVLFAIESGSRAWGFPSPNSDYDCRFVYVRPPSQHFVLEQARDVIEFPIEGDIDVGGWYLRKALLLALGGNAVVVEWANSRIVYDEVDGFRPKLLELLRQIVDPLKVSKHYLGLARSHITRIGSFDGEVKLKRVFYLLRPLIALDWMEGHGFQSLPPMNMMDCLEQAGVSSETAAEICLLVENKARTREVGSGAIPAAIARYAQARFTHHEASIPEGKRDESRQREIARWRRVFTGRKSREHDRAKRPPHPHARRSPHPRLADREARNDTRRLSADAEFGTRRRQPEDGA